MSRADADEVRLFEGDDRMKVASLGWGSLVWAPGNLPLLGEWKKAGPTLPIEFVRESGRKRMTLVIADVPESVTSLWALLKVEGLDAARDALAMREDIKEEKIQYSIGWWRKADGASHGRGALSIAAWAATHNLDGWCGRT